jgi:CheY-like chemotaxis protein
MAKPVPFPLIMIVDGRPINRIRAQNSLNSAGWRTVGFADGRDAISKLDQKPSLILAQVETDGPQGLDFAAELRTQKAPSASVPIIAVAERFSAELRDIYALGFDDILVNPFVGANLVETVERWRPEGKPEALERLGEVFGEPEIARMITGLREVLQEGLDALGSGNVPVIAHRIAGIAGILGFTELGRDWRTLSESGASDDATVRRRTRIAIAEMDRDLASLPPESLQ